MLVLITNRNLARGRKLSVVVKEAVRGGVDAVLLREKDLSYEELLPVAAEIKEITEAHRVLLMVNSQQQVAEIIRAEGYHVSFQDLIEKKPVFEGLLGVSIHSVEEGIEAEIQGASYLLASHIFPTNCKPGLPPKGLDLIRELEKRVNIPIIALGGISSDHVQQVMEAGADGIAVMSSIMEAESPYISAQEYKKNMSF